MPRHHTPAEGSDPTERPHVGHFEGTRPRRKPFQRPRKGAGSLKDLQRTLWYAIARLDYLLHDEGLPDAELLKAVHGLAQIGATYQRIVQGTELEERVAALEQALLRRRHYVA